MLTKTRHEFCRSFYHRILVLARQHLTLVLPIFFVDEINTAANTFTQRMVSSSMCLIASPQTVKKPFVTIFKTILSSCRLKMCQSIENTTRPPFSLREKKASATRREAYLQIPDGWESNFLVTYLEEWMWVWFSRDWIVSLEFIGLAENNAFLVWKGELGTCYGGGKENIASETLTWCKTNVSHFY